MDFAQHLDIHCDLGPFPTPVEHECAAVCVGGRYTRAAVQAYADRNAKVHTPIDWPGGLGKPTVRQIGAVAAAKDGTHAVEVMACPEHVQDGNFAALRDDVMGVVIAVREVSREIEVHVALDTAWLGPEAESIEYLCLAVRESGGDGVVLASQAPQIDTQYEKQVVRLVHHSGPLRVKALSPTVEAGVLLDAGVDRVGVPSRVLG